jgi:hypothetical protein
MQWKSFAIRTNRKKASKLTVIGTVQSTASYLGICNALWPSDLDIASDAVLPRKPTVVSTCFARDLQAVTQSSF